MLETRCCTITLKKHFKSREKLLWNEKIVCLLMEFLWNGPFVCLGLQVVSHSCMGVPKNSLIVLRKCKLFVYFKIFKFSMQMISLMIDYEIICNHFSGIFISSTKLFLLICLKSDNFLPGIFKISNVIKRSC